MYCNKCGKKIADGSEFCSYCGNRVAPESGKIHNSNSKAGEKTHSEIIVECNPHWTLAYKQIFACIVFLFLGLFVSSLFLYLAGAIFIYLIILMKSVKLYMTSDSIVGKKGIINTQRMTSPIRNVQDLSISDGLWGKVLGYGNISISTAGTSGAEYVFRRMSNCKKFQQEFIRVSGEIGLR